jgi:hypothetical protein
MKKTSQNMKQLVVGVFILPLLVGTTGACAPQTVEVKISAKSASQRIEAFARSANPDLADTVTFPLEETTTEETWQALQIQVFRVKEGIYENETFIINQDKVIQMGTAFGGQGVNSMVTSDLNGNGDVELLFTYSFGSGIHRTRMAAYAPQYDLGQIIECDSEYLGDLKLVQSSPSDVSVEVLIEGIDNLTETVTLGTLTLVKANSAMNLVLELNPSLPANIAENILIFK